MTTLREAAQQALEYMKSVGKMDMYPEEWAIVGRLEAALAEPVQGPVAWTLTKTLTERETTTNGYLWFSDPVNSSWTPLYAHPPQRPAEPVQEPDSPERRCGGPGCDMTCCQPVEEPVAWRYWKDKFACWEYSDTWLEFPAVPAGTKMYPLYAAPPQRPAEPVEEPVVSAGLGPLPEPAQPAEPEGYMPGCLWPLPATPDYYTAEQMREYALRALAETQEPVAYSEGRTLHWHEGKGVSDAQLFAAPIQRKPLAEWQINDLMADIDPEDRDSWSFRQGVYAAEKHHGVRK